jgi:hypothetical protein
VARFLLPGFIFLASFLAAPFTSAQSASAVVVAACGTPPATYTAGQPFPLTIDTTGKLCTSGLAASSITVGTSPIVGGTNGRLLYDNAGVVGEAAGTSFDGISVYATRFIAYGAGAITSNVAYGLNALVSNTSGSDQVAVGQGTLAANTTGINNVAVGSSALNQNTTGGGNVAVGTAALFTNTTGVNNFGLGAIAMLNNTIGDGNIAIGTQAAFSNIAGDNNIGLGTSALYNVGASTTAGAFAVGISYTISFVGTTDFTLIGAASNTVGVTFTATGAGSGTGTAFPSGTSASYNTAIGASTGVGIIYGANNTVVGARVSGLAAGLTGAVIFASGDGTIHRDYNKTYTGLWTDANPVTSTSAAPTAAGGGGTCATGAVAGNVAAGTITLTGACATTNTITLTFATAAPTGYNCDLKVRNTPAAAIGQTSVTSTTISVFTVFGATPTGATDVVQFVCSLY